MSAQSDNQISQTFPVRQLTEHERKQLIPTSEVFHVLVAIILGYNSIEPISVKEGGKLSENEFVLMHCKLIRIAKVRIEIRFF